ncbi:2-dehydro-3-deoxygluconokinase [Georgenia soli]|uniref:2-dehydro-3-deoxygluconokinase n=1 Tax=Georgenia soli TaxID=638953 RepID=A0A2A9F0Z5_9MICO|nr:sugar kinase [Georgenia soli]PFG44974.1 2-dehydro-3-deoxygluconokinase [Georgenia soli]
MSSGQPKVLTFGETMGLCASAGFGAFAHQPAAAVSFGGAESNVAIGLQRLGIPTTWVSRLGDDLIGRMILRGLRAEGVDVRASVDPVRPTGFMLKERTSASETNVLFYRAGSAASHMTPDDLPLDDLAQWDLLHITGIMPALSDSARETTLAAVARAHDVGVPISLDINYRSRLWSQDDAAAFVREVIARCRYVFAGDDEARIVVAGQHEPVDLAKGLVDLGAKTAVVKLGPNGALALDGGEITVMPSVPVSQVIDTVGAGDAFVAGFLAERLHGASIHDAMRTAVRSGAMLCEAPGDWEGAPDRSRLERSGDPVTR